MPTLNTYLLPSKMNYLYCLKHEERGETHRDHSGKALYQNNKRPSLVHHYLFKYFIFKVYFFISLKFCSLCYWTSFMNHTFELVIRKHDLGVSYFLINQILNLSYLLIIPFQLIFKVFPQSESQNLQLIIISSCCQYQNSPFFSLHCFIVWNFQNQWCIIMKKVLFLCLNFINTFFCLIVNNAIDYGLKLT